MGTDSCLSPKPNSNVETSSPRESCSSRSFTISLSSENSAAPKTVTRSKSLSNICVDGYTPAELRMIRERLLRTNARLESSAIRNFSRRQKLTLLSLALVDFMSFCSMSILAPFFPNEAAEKGMSDTMVGFVFSFYALVMFLTSPIFGKLIPRIGPKFLFLSGMFLAGSCNLLFGTLEYITDKMLFTVFCLLIRGFEALGASAFSTASYVFVVNSFPQNIGTVLGILETFVGLGMSIGPAIGGFLYWLGGFELPFFVLGIVMVLTIPINAFLLPVINDCNVTGKGTSISNILRVPAVIVTGIVVVVVSSTWSFLDPTLEPHLRQFNLTPGNIGLIFLLFSALYGISSPAWGWLADKVNNHWSMMVWGLLISTVGLLLLGPCPYIPFLQSSLWLDLVALSILGVSVALALLPTFQSVLTSAIEGGCRDSLSTYSVVAGIWSCMYSLGEVVGPSLGGFMLQYYGFPIAATVMAIMTFTLAVVSCIFFTIKSHRSEVCGSISSSSEASDWKKSCSQSDDEEKSPLLLSDSYRSYTQEKVQYYEQSRKQENELGGDTCDQVTDIRGTVSITSKGACEV